MKALNFLKSLRRMQKTEIEIQLGIPAEYKALNCTNLAQVNAPLISRSPDTVWFCQL